MAAHAFLRKSHRVVAALFLLTIPPAAYFSMAGDKGDPSVFVYLPLFPMMILTITGTYLLVRPWILKRRGQPDA